MKCPDDYNVVLMAFPGDILACVRIDNNGYPTAYINDYLSPEAKRKALRHELNHFKNGDFFNHVTIYDAEKKAACTLKADLMFRSFRDLTDAELAELSVGGLFLLNDAEGPIQCTEPLEMPEPLFEREPESYANVGKKVW